MLDLSHPILRRRLDAFHARIRAAGGSSRDSSLTRTDAEQRALRAAWEAGTYRVPSVADPDARGPHCPPEFGDWTVVGSMHTPQADGCSHAADVSWSGISGTEVTRHANAVGLRQTVPREPWHLQAWDASGLFPAPELDEPAPSLQEDDDMLTIHTPTPRPGAAVLDFTYLPADGDLGNGWACASSLHVRRLPGGATSVRVYFDGAPILDAAGAPMDIALPDDGRTVTLVVPRAGLCSVEGAGIAAEAREWLRRL